MFHTVHLLLGKENCTLCLLIKLEISIQLSPS